MKQAIVIRTDLKMGKGKLASQAAHASIAAYLKSSPSKRKYWLKTGMKKVVVKVSSLKELIHLYSLAKKQKLPCVIITDAGLTQIKPNKTAVGIGPADDRKIDKITGKLKLL